MSAGSKRERIMVTPEGIALPVRLASRGARFGALALDLVFMVLAMVGTSIALVTIAGGTQRFAEQFSKQAGLGSAPLQFVIVVWILAMFLLRYAYFVYFELGPRGATPGKRITGIRIAARDGGRLTAEMVIARNLLRDIELFLPAILLMAGGVDAGAVWLAATGWFCLFMAFPFLNRDALRAGDVIAGSWVLEAPRLRLQAAMTATPAAAPAAATYRFTADELAVYGEFELKTLERVLRDDRADTIDEVYATIAGKIGGSDGWGDERRFLRDYYVQLRERLEAGMRLGRRKADKFAGDER